MKKDSDISFLDKVFPVIFLIIGVIGVFFSIFDLIYSSVMHCSSITGSPYVTTILCLILAALGYERRKQQKNIEEKLNENFTRLFDYIQDVKGYEIIEGHSNITPATIEGLTSTNTCIRATSFKNISGVDSPIKYYSELGRLIQNKEISYVCCYNKGHSFENMIRAFDSLNFSEKEYRRMEYYEFENQNYFNLLMVDADIAFIGFPKFGDAEHMNIMLKITSDTEKNKILLQGLASWFDKVLLDPMKSKSYNQNSGIYRKMDTLELLKPIV